MSSLTEMAPRDPADAPWIKVSSSVIDEAIGILILAQQREQDPDIVREIAYVRHRLQLAAE